MTKRKYEGVEWLGRKSSGRDDYAHDIYWIPGEFVVHTLCEQDWLDAGYEPFSGTEWCPICRMRSRRIGSEYSRKLTIARKKREKEEVK